MQNISHYPKFVSLAAIGAAIVCLLQSANLSAADAPLVFKPMVDDVMISYGEDGSSVGPHIDQYDVFLLQALG